MRNTDLFAGLARLFNNQSIRLQHPDPNNALCADLDPQADSIFAKKRCGGVLSKKWCEVKGWYSRIHGNFTKEDSGEHDIERRDFQDYLALPGMTPKAKKLAMYTHLTFYGHALEDLATKGIPGGGADGNTGARMHEQRRAKAARLTKDDLTDVFSLVNDNDRKIGDALQLLAESQAQNAKRQKRSFLFDLKEKGQLNDEQKRALQAAVDRELADL